MESMMGIFSRIREKLFGAAHEEPAKTITAEPVKPATAGVVATPSVGKDAVSPSASNEAVLKPAAEEPGAAASSAPVDVAAILDEAVKKNGQKLDWRHSIVDLMKALGMDATLQERKELADELGFTGDKSDSASMNMWLHKALLKALAENGGKVPTELLD